jgi:hypothetical protein
MHEGTRGFSTNSRWRKWAIFERGFDVAKDDEISGVLVSCLLPLWFVCERFLFEMFCSLLAH